MARIFMLALLIPVAIASIACGSKISDEDVRMSDRYYEAAYVAWFEERDNLEAIRHLTRSVKANPDNDHAQYLLGTLRLGRNELDEAEKHLRKALELRGEERPAERAEAQNSLGVLLMHKEKYAEAIELLEAASSQVLNREPWLAMGNLGWAYTEIGEYDKAIDILKRALFDQPLFCVGKYRLGEAYYKKGEYEKAEASVKGAISIKEGGCDSIQEAHHLLGMTYLRLGRENEARESFATCAELDPASDLGVECSRNRDEI